MCLNLPENNTITITYTCKITLYFQFKRFIKGHSGNYAGLRIKLKIKKSLNLIMDSLNI